MMNYGGGAEILAGLLVGVAVGQIFLWKKQKYTSVWILIMISLGLAIGTVYSDKLWLDILFYCLIVSVMLLLRIVFNFTTWLESQQANCVTPYDSIDQHHEESGDNCDIKHYDVFISYKSEDIDVVRPVVDQLIAAGLTVWFAEYRISSGD